MSTLARISRKELPERYVVFLPHTSGLADRITGLVTTFLFSVLAERVFLVYPHPGHQPLELIYDQPHYNWSARQNYSEETLTAVKEYTGPTPECRVCPSGAPGTCNVCAASAPGDPPTYAWINFLDNKYMYDRKHNPKGYDDFHTQINFREVYPDAHTIFFTSNKGRTISLFRNPHHREALYALGLTPGNAFRCGLEFLFFPKPEVLAPVADLLRSLASSPLTVGVQIRTGDNAFGQTGDLDDAAAARFLPYFECASAIAERHSPGAAPAFTSATRWFLITDTPNVRRWAQRRYGERLLTLAGAAVGHVSMSHDARVLFLAAAEHWLFGAAHLFVLTEDSGFGRTAAMRRGRLEAMYTIRKEQQQQQQGGDPVRACREGQHDALVFTGGVWSGV